MTRQHWVVSTPADSRGVSAGVDEQTIRERGISAGGDEETIRERGISAGVDEQMIREMGYSGRGGWRVFLSALTESRVCCHSA